MKKIMFNDKYGLTDAVLQGRKTMTRRIVTDYEFNQWDGRQIMLGYDPESNTQEYGLLSDDESGEVVRKRLLKYPYRCGEVLAVAQSYENVHDYYFDNEDDDEHVIEILDYYLTPGWSNKLFVRPDLMPHQLQITDIKIERLQDISEDDCLKEGVYIDESGPRCYHPFFTFKNSFIQRTPLGWDNAIDAFAALIDAVSGKGTWKSNPYVFAYTFKLVK